MNNTSILKGKLIIRKKEIPCYILLVSLFFPTRGSILGLSFYHILAIALIAYLLSNPSKPKDKAPRYLWIYGIVLLAMDIYWFQLENWWYYISNLAPYILAFLFILYGIKTKKSFEHYIDFIIFVFSMYSLFCIVESLTSFNIFDLLTNTHIEEYTFTNEIRFGFIRNRGAVDISINNGMLQCLVLSMCSYRKATKRKQKYLIAYILVFFSSFLTLSRGVWIQLLVSTMMIVFVMPETKKLKLVARTLLVLILTLAVGSFGSSGFAENIIEMIKNMFLSIASVFTESNNSSLIGVGHRFVLWSWVYETVKSSIVFGLGVGKEVSVTTTLGYNKISIEVMWLYLLYQTGIIGMINFFIFQFNSIKYSLKRTDKKLFGPKYNNFNYYLLSASIGYFIALFACSGFEDLRFYYIFLALGIAYNRINKYSSVQEN